MKAKFFLLFVLGTAWTVAGQAPLPQAEPFPLPGRFTAPLVVDAKIPASSSVRFRFMEGPVTTGFSWTSPLTLDALEGETRTYTLRLTTELPSGESLTRDYRYEVYRPAKALPTVQPVPGVYTSAVTVKAAMPDGWKATEGGSPAKFPLVLDAAPGSKRVCVLEATGSEGQRLSWSYTIDRRDQESESVDLVSPIQGDWSNSQSLVVLFRGVDKILWSYGEKFDPLNAQVYRGPVVLDRPGDQSISVGGRSRVTGRWIEKTVRWKNGSSLTTSAPWPASGVKSTGLDLSAAPGWQLSWDEGRSWVPSQSLHREEPSESSRKLLTLQARFEKSTFRYVYWLDARAPQVPQLEFVGGWNPQVVVSGSSSAWYRMVWTLADGKTIDEPESFWGPTGVWKVPDQVVGAKVVAVGYNALTSAPATIGFAETGWSTPVWEPWDQKGPQADRGILPLGGRVIPRPGFQAVYEVSDRPDVPEPSGRSAILEGAFLPSIPWGSDRTFYVRFAWRDPAGLTGPASGVQTIRVDRIPPSAPEVTEVSRQVLVKAAEGEEEGALLSWAVSTSRVSSPETLTFQPYRTALDSESLKAAAAGKLWFHALAVDRAGNPGPARLNVALSSSGSGSESSIVQVDPDPSVGDTPIEDKGVYPWPQFRLRALDRGQEFWVGVTDQALTLPTDWASKLQPWTGVLSRSVARGDRRTFLLFWNVKAPEGWLWDQPKTTTLTLDQGPPASPIISGSWPLGPLGSAWTLSLQPGRPGDSLRYSYTLDGSAPSDPVTSGQSWPGTQTWDAPPDGRISIRLRVAAVSVSGLSIEAPIPGVVMVDRVSPPSVLPPLQPFTYRTTGFSVPAPSSALVVRYTLTSDGSLPAVPSKDSPAIGREGMSLQGQNQQTVLYRFRWRAFSEAGLPGAPSDAYSVLVDRTQAARTVESTNSEVPTSIPPPRITGIPGSGVSSAPVTLKADWPIGQLKYELREGIGTPRSVTALSAIWPSSLVLDGGVGVDRSFAVSVRGFSSDGRPLTDELQVQIRVDRSIPQAPRFSLRSDLRRPEVTLVPDSTDSNPEETLYYRWSWVSFPQGAGRIEWRSLDDGTPIFASPEGNLSRLRVEAFVRDEAGNEGPSTELSALVDQNVVYLAPMSAGDGTRLKPVGSLDDALEKMHREGLSVLFVAAGSYPLVQTADLGGIKAFGGWSAEEWELVPAMGRSQWVATAPYTGKYLIESGARDWSLESIDLSTGSVELERVVETRGATVRVHDSNWVWSKSQGGWDQVGGSLDLRGVSANFTAQPKGAFISLLGVDTRLRDFSLSALQNQGAVLFDLEDSPAVVQNLSVVSKRASGYDSVWSSLRGRLTMDGARILAGEGASRATGLLLKQTDAALWNMELALFASGSNTGLLVTSGQVELQKSSISLLSGAEFNQALVLDHSVTSLRNFLIKLESGSYQGGIDADGGSLNLETGRVLIAGGGKSAWGASFLDPCLVTMTDTSWVLTTKTDGELWKISKPWAKGSQVSASTSSGW